MAERFSAYIYKSGRDLKKVEINGFGNVVEGRRTTIGENVIIKYCPVEFMPIEELFDSYNVGEREEYVITPLPFLRN